MRSKRSFIAIMLCIALMATMLVGCGGKTKDEPKKDAVESPAVDDGDDTQEPVVDSKDKEVVTFITNRTDLIKTTFADYKADFESKNPNIEIKFESMTDYETDMGIRMQTDKYGDVLMLPNSIQSTDFANFFEPLGTVEELGDKYKEDYLYAKYTDGVVYGLPAFRSEERRVGKEC